MGIISFFKTRHNVIQKYHNKREKLEEDWELFLSRKTYLTFSEKQLFLSRINTLFSIPWHYWLSISLFRQRDIILDELEMLEYEIGHFNDSFIQDRLYRFASFFDGSDDHLPFSLDLDQRKAIIKDDQHNLVIAGAGSGKTSVITSRIAYLIRRPDSVQPTRILALAFTNSAALEMRDRIKKFYHYDIEIMTFHKLGRQILKNNSNSNPRVMFGGGNTDKEENEFFLMLLNKFLEEKTNQILFFNYLAYHSDNNLPETSFAVKEDYYEYMKTKKYVTLDNTIVKSFSEREIGNFFFIHNITYEYEPLVDWVDSTLDKEYHPDFYLPDFDIYIEHWGLNRHKEVPKWFTKSSEEYTALREWKLDQFQKHKKVLVETWEFERIEGDLIHNLKGNLKWINKSITFKQRPYQELVKKTYSFKEKQDSIINLLRRFIKVAKSNMLFINDIKKRVDNHKYTKSQRQFGKIALEIYQLYESELKARNRIDFNDMINKAVEIIHRNPDRYRNKYDHILIDEFQDISFQRLELIKGFVNENSNTKLFCVGDDWQSIYQFTGSNVEFIVNMDQYFPHPETTLLQTNYRSNEPIVQISNHLIQYNEKQIKKTILSSHKKGKKPVQFVLSEKFEFTKERQSAHLYKTITEIIGSGEKPSEILVLARFWKVLLDLKQFFGLRGLPIDDKQNSIRFNTVHTSKGTEAKYVFIVDVNSGKYGFPAEIDESSILELAKRSTVDNQLEEERRLFYVAITRSKTNLYIYTTENTKSRFLNELGEFIQNPVSIGFVDFIHV